MITRIRKGGTQEERQCDGGRRRPRPTGAGFEAGDGGHELKDSGRPLEAGEAKEKDLPRGL